jgi:hypothetical protein
MATESPEKLNLNNPTEENPKETLDATVSPTDKPDRIEEEPTDDALIEPSVTTVDSDAGESEKTGEDSKSDVAAVASAAAAGDADDVSPGFQYSEEDSPCRALRHFSATHRAREA